MATCSYWLRTEMSWLYKTICSSNLCLILHSLGRLIKCFRRHYGGDSRRSPRFDVLRWEDVHQGDAFAEDVERPYHRVILLVYGNVYKSVLHDEVRINIVVEVGICLLGVHHASVWKFLERVQKDQKMNETLILQLQDGHTKMKHSVPRKYTNNQERIKVIVQNYEKYKNDNEVFVYLRAISYGKYLFTR